MTSQQIQHLYWRAGFGLSPKELSQKIGKTQFEIVNDLFNNSKAYIPLKINMSELDRYKSYPKNGTSERKQFQQIQTKKLKELNYFWIYNLVNTKQILRERMTLFWANHFVCRDSNVRSIMQFNNVLRKHALGNFGNFVKAISKESSMIKYLNLNSNNKRKPNENFARELMELFTLGVGNYSESDIKEAARAFTGYKTNFKSEFVFNKRQHDNGIKAFFGKKGNFNGDDIIDIILDEKQCAVYICSKVYRYFVNDSINASHLELMADLFYKDYNIEKLMKFVFTSDWFYDSKNIGSKIKSPIDLIVGMHRTIPLQFNKIDELLKVQGILDQKLLYPPNVAGWKGGKNWINTNSMLLRVKLPSMILENESYSIQPKGNFTKNFRFEFVKNKYQDKLDVYVGWKSYRKEVKRLKPEEFLRSLIICDLSNGTEKYLSSIGKYTKKRNLSKIMSLPEYQMC